MPIPARHPDGRSQLLMSATSAQPPDKIVLDARTVKKLALLVEQSAYNLQSSRDSDILLASLENYLGESSNLEEARKSSLLLRGYCDVVPEWLEEAQECLAEAAEQLAFILAASNLGAANTSGSHDDD